MPPTPPIVVNVDELPTGPPDKPTPNIKVIFRGFIITDLTAESAVIGALDPTDQDAACHKPIIHVFEIIRDVSTEITNDRHKVPFDLTLTKDLFLSVTPKADVKMFFKDKEPFNRLDEVESDKKDFRWFVDFNSIHKRDLPDHLVKADLTKLKPKFTLNSGVFHSSKLSDGDVTIQRGKGTTSESTKKRFGRFATEITARIVLAGGAFAVFSQEGAGNPMVITPTETRYEIVFDCTCRSANEQDSDLGLIYKHKIIVNKNGSGIDDTEQVTLERFGAHEDIHRLTPEVYCSGGNAGPPPGA